MPIYPFKCRTCGRVEELLASVSEYMRVREKQRCPDCGDRMKQVITPPALQTDTRFMQGSHLDDGFGNDERSRRIARAKAAAAGVNVSGMKYSPQLCPLGETLSPKAWYGSRDDVKRRAAEKSCGVDGSVHYTPPSGVQDNRNPLDEPYHVADDIVEKLIERDVIEQTGGKGAMIPVKEYRDLKEKTRKRLSGAKT